MVSVNGERLLSRINELGKIGKDAEGRRTRLAASDADKQNWMSMFGRRGKFQQTKQIFLKHLKICMVLWISLVKSSTGKSMLSLKSLTSENQSISNNARYKDERATSNEDQEAIPTKPHVYQLEDETLLITSRLRSLCSMFANPVSL